MPNVEMIVAVGMDHDGGLQILGPVGSKVAHRFRVPHTTALLMPIQAGRILIHRRSSFKLTSPSRLDLPGGHANWSDVEPDVADPLLRLAMRTAMREANEEIICAPAYGFSEADLVQVGAVGEFGCDRPDNVEFSTLFLVQVPPDVSVAMRDSDERGERELDMQSLTIDELVELYRCKPDDFADGAARILARIARGGDVGRLLRERLG